MDSKKQLEKYLKASPATIIIALVLALVCVASIIGSVVSFNSYEAPEPVEFFPYETPAGDYAYIDVLAVSSWIYKYDNNTYYAALDQQGYIYTVRLSDAQFEAMSAQFEYGMSDDLDAPAPQPYRLCGMSSSVNSDLAKAMASSLGLGGEEEYRERLGEYYLNATSAPSSDAGGILMIAALFSGIMALILFLIALPKNKALKRSIARLEELGELDKAANQLAAPDNIIYDKQQIMLSKDYIYSRAGGAVLRCGDLYWCFMRVQRMYFKTIAEILIGNSVHCGQISLAANPSGKNYAGTLEQIMQQLKERNPQLLLGYVKDNIVAFNAAKKAAKNGMQ